MGLMIQALSPEVLEVEKLKTQVRLLKMENIQLARQAEDIIAKIIERENEIYCLKDITAKQASKIRQLKSAMNSHYGLGGFTVDISTEDCKEIVRGIDAMILTMQWLVEIDDIEQDRIDNLQRIKDGFTELIEYGGR